jgi:hypothetical protein
MNNKAVKEKILASIVIAEGKGFTLITDDWGSDTMKCACAIGCVYVAVDVNISNNENMAAEILGVSDKWITSFTDGFDGNGVPTGAHEPEAWNIGREIRLSTNPLTYDEFVYQMDDEFDAAYRARGKTDESA